MCRATWRKPDDVESTAKIGSRRRVVAAASFAGWTSAEAAERYVAQLTPLNADKLGSSASGTATFEIENGKLKTTIELKGLPPNIAHLQHFHGFADKDATCATSKDDVNGDGYIDLLETEPVSGVTMLPFHSHPATLEISSDNTRSPMAPATRTTSTRMMSRSWRRHSTGSSRPLASSWLSASSSSIRCLTTRSFRIVRSHSPVFPLKLPSRWRAGRLKL